MHWAEIICALKKKGYSHKRVAEEVGVTPPIVSSVIRGKKTSHPVAHHIANITGLLVDELWPGVYLNEHDYVNIRKGKKRGRLPICIEPQGAE